MKTFEEYSLHQMNAPAIDGINSTKVRRGGTYYQFGQNTDDNEFDAADGQGDGASDDGIDGSVSPNVAAGSEPIGSNDANIGMMANTPGNKIPTEEEKDSIMIPAYSYTKKGITGDKFTKVGYAGKIKKFSEF